MFDFGFSEGLLITILLIVIIKPEDLPKVFHNIGKAYGKIQRLYYQFQNEMHELFYDNENKNNDKLN